MDLEALKENDLDILLKLTGTPLAVLVVGVVAKYSLAGAGLVAIISIYIAARYGIVPLTEKLKRDWEAAGRVTGLQQDGSRAVSLEGVDDMSGHQFETFLAGLLQDRFDRAWELGGSGDFGADLIVRDGQEKIVVQAKCYGDGRKIGPRTVRATLGARTHHDCDSAMIVTNQAFTENARKQAESGPCYLIDREQLGRWIQQT